MPESRLFFIDNVRTLLICLVVMVHAAVSYGGEGGWYYAEPTDSMAVTIVLTLFNAVTQSFFMSLLFLVAGYFTIESYSGSHTLRYIVSRLKRLGIPLVAFYVGVGPLTNYIAGFLDGTEFTYKLSLHVGPMWFAQALLIFTALFLLIRTVTEWISHPRQSKQNRSMLPTWTPIVLFILLLWLTTIPARALWPMGEGVAGMQLGSFAHYAFMFLIGLLIHGKNWALWLEKVPTNKVITVAVVGILMLPIAMVLGVDPEYGFDYFKGGLYWQAIVYSAWESTMCVFMSLWVMKGIKKCSTHDIPVLKKMGRANYGVYIFHAPILVSISWLLMDVSLHPLLKFLIASALTIVISFPFAYGLTRLPVLKRVI
jgi:peptidoglycan/LPS O-acetylase OafA/YrhL